LIRQEQLRPMGHIPSGAFIMDALKISELITKLESLKQEHGDLPVWGCIDDISCNGPDEVKRVNVEWCGWGGPKSLCVLLE